MTLAIIATACFVVMTGLFIRQLLKSPEPCNRTHYEYINSHDPYPSPYGSTVYNLMLNEAHAATEKAEALAAERLRMLHRLNDIYTNRSCND